MSSVSGLLKIGEAQATMWSIGKRQRGSVFGFYALLLALMVGGLIAGFVVTFLIDIGLDAAKVPHNWTEDVPVDGGWIGLASGFVAYYFLSKRLLVVRFRRRLVEKGSQPELPLQLVIRPDVLFYEVGDLQKIAKWSGVSEVFRSHAYWIFLALSDPIFAPMRFFTSVDAERAFIKDALSHMNEAARARSPDAVAFAEGK